MNPRTLFVNTLTGREIDRLPFIECESVPQTTYRRWVKQGWLPAQVDPRVFFGFDCAGISQAQAGFETLPIVSWACPEYELPAGMLALGTQQQSHEGRVITRYCTKSGLTARCLAPEHENEFPARVFVDAAVRDRSDWLRVKERYQPSPQGRYPADWLALAQRTQTAEHPIGLSVPGLYNCVSNFVLGMAGPQGLLMSVYDRPSFVREMIDHFAEFICAIYEPALREARIDFVVIADQNGSDDAPFLKPDLFRTLFLDAYRKVVRYFRERVDIVLGKIAPHVTPYLPMVLELGFTGLSYIPGQVDMEHLIEQYGDRLSYLRCIDKWALLKSPETIAAEVDHRLSLARRAPVIPCLNEILDGVSFERYRFYAEYLRQRILG